MNNQQDNQLSTLPKIPENAEVAYFAGGCFWGVEYFFKEALGVLSTTVGYMGGNLEKPTYEDVLSHTSGHAETIQVVFGPTKTDYETLARLFFEIHDPTQIDRQGPDIGSQYRSSVFYTTPKQKEITEKLINILKSKEYEVVTKVAKAETFWPAEDYHQDYYEVKGGTPYCHIKVEKF